MILSEPMAVVSVDLAARRYQDIGIAVLRGQQGSVRIELVQPRQGGLEGVPDPGALANFCTLLATRSAAELIFLDGPQGWRAEISQFEHMRVCERCTLTPGKTGLPHIVKPAPWKRMADFSVAVFDALDAAGWPRFSGKWPTGRAAIESFPTHAWRTIGFSPLPGKNRRQLDLSPWMQFLHEHFGVEWPRLPSHDELQAVVAGIGGLMLQDRGPFACDLHGVAPFPERNIWREGFIVSPKQPVHERPLPTCYCRPI